MKKTYLVQMLLLTNPAAIDHRIVRSAKTAEQIREAIQVGENGYSDAIVTELVSLGGRQNEFPIPEGTLLPDSLSEEQVRKLFPEVL